MGGSSTGSVGTGGAMSPGVDTGDAVAGLVTVGGVESSLVPSHKNPPTKMIAPTPSRSAITTPPPTNSHLAPLELSGAGAIGPVIVDTIGDGAGSGPAPEGE